MWKIWLIVLACRWAAASESQGAFESCAAHWLVSCVDLQIKAEAFASRFAMRCGEETLAA